MNESENRAPFFVFTGIVVLSILFFFLLTSGDDKKNGPLEAKGPHAQPASVASSPGVKPPDGKFSIPVEMDLDGRRGKSGDASSTAAASSDFADAPQPVRAFVNSAITGDLENILDASATPIPSGEKELLVALFDSGEWTVAKNQPPVELGQFGDKFRWMLPLRDTSSEASATSASQVPHLYLDLVRGPQKRGWRLADVRIPPDLVPAAVDALKSRGQVIDTTGIRTAPDALMTAEHFMNAVANADYERALSMADLDQISREKIAGLFIIMEEGKYRMQQRKPLMATVATADSAWIVGRIRSDAGMDASDFGVEMARTPGSDWKITGLHFSKLLASFAASSSPESVPYTPIVENPSGGESLVLYFGYDEDMLHLRAQRQLLIVATLLKEDSSKRLRITGHADAMGTEDYNFALSGRRAYSVRDQLIQLGVPARQIETQGFGESTPLADNQREDGTDNPEGRSKNRRTEIFLNF
ncbi:MAG: outer membrane protein OmpA-like peptidoglycan-associated protein [Verrucomicrobiales bacterium]|jgi:outer membrane protein OmpA-like peptidoglycan-associated protein